MKAKVVEIVGIPGAWQGVVVDDEGTEIFCSCIYEEWMDGDKARDIALADAQDKLAEILSRRE